MAPFFAAPVSLRAAPRKLVLEKGRCAILDGMTKAQVKKILDRVLTWPPERQADVAHVVQLMEEQDNSSLRLTDEQAAEVRRRLSESDPETLTLAEFNERLRSRYGV